MKNLPQILALATGLLSNVQAMPGQCKVQSCVVAFISGSSKTTYTYPPGKPIDGQNLKGQACIKDYLGKLNVPFPSHFAITRAADELTSPAVEAKTESLQATDCKPETILWVRGTYEIGEFGNLVEIGKGIQKSFSGAGWGTIGLKDTDGYDAAGDNNYCVGLPGGYACIPWLNKQVERCPNTKFILGGYSQGAMVSRICIAFASDAAKKAVKGLLLLGDPMNGADNKGINSNRIKTFCQPTDTVCEGRFRVNGAHLAYKSDVGAGLEWAKGIINT